MASSPILVGASLLNGETALVDEVANESVVAVGDQSGDASNGGNGHLTGARLEPESEKTSGGKRAAAACLQCAHWLATSEPARARSH